jgi:hypothetical protein
MPFPGPWDEQIKQGRVFASNFGSKCDSQQPSKFLNEAAFDCVHHGFKPVVGPELLVNRVKVISQGWQSYGKLLCNLCRILCRGKQSQDARFLLRKRFNRRRPGYAVADGHHLFRDFQHSCKGLLELLAVADVMEEMGKQPSVKAGVFKDKRRNGHPSPLTGLRSDLKIKGWDRFVLNGTPMNAALSLANGRAESTFALENFITRFG